MPAIDIHSRAKKHRDALRMAGLRPVQIGAQIPGGLVLLKACRRQCALVSAADNADSSLQQFMDKALAEVDGWTA